MCETTAVQFLSWDTNLEPKAQPQVQQSERVRTGHDKTNHPNEDKRGPSVY